MVKKLLFVMSFVVLSLCSVAQNLQTHFDFGHMYKNLDARPNFTTTVEMFRPDSWGSTFFFVDMDYGSTVKGAYWEIAREICFWQNSKMNWLSAHIEYDGGMSVGTSFNNSFLVGATYSGHSADFSKTWSISLMYKAIPGTVGLDLSKDVHNFQITGVWGINFAKGWCTFSGFIDFWREARIWQGTEYIFLSEPQFWVNLNKIPKMEKVNLSIGTEVELSNNFVGKGFYAIPTIAAKWTF